MPRSPWAGPDFNYRGHNDHRRGPATAHTCAMPGCGARAHRWSIVRADAAPPTDPTPSGHRPLCTACHQRYDLIALINEGWPHRV